MVYGEFNALGRPCNHDGRWEPEWLSRGGFWFLDDTSEYHAWGLIEILDHYYEHLPGYGNYFKPMVNEIMELLKNTSNHPYAQYVFLRIKCQRLN